MRFKLKTQFPCSLLGHKCSELYRLRHNKALLTEDTELKFRSNHNCQVKPVFIWFVRKQAFYLHGLLRNSASLLLNVSSKEINEFDRITLLKTEWSSDRTARADDAGQCFWGGAVWSARLYQSSRYGRALVGRGTHLDDGYQVK